MVARDNLLDGKRFGTLDDVCLDRHGFDLFGGREGPARATLALVLDGGGEVAKPVPLDWVGGHGWDFRHVHFRAGVVGWLVGEVSGLHCDKGRGRGVMRLGVSRVV